MKLLIVISIFSTLLIINTDAYSTAAKLASAMGGSKMVGNFVSRSSGNQVGNLVGKASGSPMMGNLMGRAVQSSIGQKVVGRALGSGGGLLMRLADNDRNSRGIMSVFVKVFQFLAKIKIKLLTIVQNIVALLIISVFNILGFIAELPLALVTAMKMNFALLSSTLDKYGISINGVINTIRYIFKLEAPNPSLGMAQIAYANNGLMNPLTANNGLNLPQMGLGMSTQPILGGRFGK